MPIHHSFFLSPIGTLEIKATDEYINSVLFINKIKSTKQVIKSSEKNESGHPLISECKKQLREYFDGQRMKFDLPLYQNGSGFQQKIWAALTGIPYGKTISYLELSKRIGNVKAIRAVGAANGKNAISILVPCHRVTGINGALTGYSGGLWRKKWLLSHEAKYANGVQTLF